MISTNIPIIEVDYGIANNFGTYIEVNKYLKKYPHLFNPVIEHELSHTDKVISAHDLKLDFYQNNNINSWDMLKFMFKHPKSFTQLAPFYWTKKKGFVYDLNLIVMYLIMIGVFTITIYIGSNYL